MENKKKVIIYSIIVVAALIVLAASAAYAYFQADVDVKEGKVDVDTTTPSSAEVEYNAGEDIELIYAEPGDSATTEFNIVLKASNKTKETIAYGIDWIIEQNEFVYEPANPGAAQLTYSLYYSNDNSGWTSLAENADCTDWGNTATSEVPITKTIAANQKLSAEANTTETIYWKFVLEYKAYDFNQATNMSKSFLGKIKVTGI